MMEHELTLIQRAMTGDEAAMRSLWSRHAPHVDMVVRRLVGGDLDLAADIAQEVSNMVKTQILSQSAMAVLAQANAAPQALLSLLS